jgi:hypothetical protein
MSDGCQCVACRDTRTAEREKCAAEVEAFAIAYVEKWERIFKGRGEATKAQGWAILQAAAALRSTSNTGGK